MGFWRFTPSFLVSGQARLGRIVVLTAVGGVGALLATSCLTPDFTFPDDGDGSVGGGPGVVAGHCNNRAKDADESDTDCGGLDCDPCGLGRSCDTGSDCAGGECNSGKCQAASCTDGEKNGNETDVDCGGNTDCAPCDAGARCTGAQDCDSGVCAGGRCAEPSCDDRVKNGREADVDCGGACTACGIGQECVVDDDCAPPPSPDMETVSCEAGSCQLDCGTGKADCNQSAMDGCETTLATDPDHCGACDAACAPDNGVGQCVAGNCSIESCTAPYEDCDAEVDNGCEANLNTDEENCGSCNAPCSTAGGTPTCSAGSCSIACDTDAGYADCNDNPDDGCEIDTDVNVLHCRAASESPADACDNVCSPTPPNSAYCDDGCQEKDCSGQCGGSTPCGACDVDLLCNDALTSVDDCGGCGIACSVQNGTPFCNTSGSPTCDVLSCESGFSDCDDLYVNGCEVQDNALNNVTRCGGCLGSDKNPGAGQNCLAAVGSQHVAGVRCGAGPGAACEIASCDENWADCDGIFSNGCEVNITTSDANCGGCLSGPTTAWDSVDARDCDEEYDNADGICSGGACSMGACDQGFLNCGGGSADGCETAETATACGSCSTSCQTPTGTTANVCDIGSPSSCAPTCGSNYLSCDGNTANGCETNIATNDERCGSCANDCTSKIGSQRVTGVNCSSKSCEVTACQSGYADCNDTFGDGCEANVRSVTRCGGCLDSDANTGGGTTCTTVPGGNTTVACSGGTTCVRSCIPPWLDNDGDLQQEVSNGCESLAVGLVNSGTYDHARFSDPGYPTVSFTHTLENGAADNDYRFILIAVTLQTNTEGNPDSVTYGGSSASLLAGRWNTNSVSVSLWGVYDADLPASSGSKTVSVVSNDSGWGGMAVDVLEFENVKQYPNPSVTPPPTTSGVNTVSCDGTDASASFTISSGSWIYGMAGAQRGSSTTAEHPANASTPGGSLSTETLDLLFLGGNPHVVSAAGHSGGPLSAGSRSGTFSFTTDCYQQGIVMVEIESGP